MCRRCIYISYKFHRIPDRQFRFITKFHDLLGEPSYVSAQCPVENVFLSKISLVTCTQCRMSVVNMYLSAKYPC